MQDIHSSDGSCMLVIPSNLTILVIIKPVDLILISLETKLDKNTILSQYFGYYQFREGQAELIDNILAGRDVLGIMPTGSGKSLCFQIPALMQKGITLVVSPLISLMKDQVSVNPKRRSTARCLPR